MLKMLAATLVAVFALYGAALADCGVPHTAQSSSPVTAQGNTSVPESSTPQSSQSGG
jgi:hypothetical protein